jgi:membrane protease YdiL (CAAX protease family)
MTAADTPWTGAIDPLTLVLLNGFAIALLVGSIIAWIRHFRTPKAVAASGSLQPWSISWLDAVAIVGSAVVLIWFSQNLIAALLRLYHGNGFSSANLGLWEMIAFGLVVQLALLLTVILGKAIFPQQFPPLWRERRWHFFATLRVLADAYLRFLPIVLLVMFGWTQLLMLAANWGWIEPAQPQLLVTSFAGSEDRLAQLVFAFMAVVVAPIAEELFFRGVLYRFLKAKTGLIPALLLSAVLFALVHYSLHAFVGLVVLGVLLAVLYEKTADLRVSILFHAAFNMTSLAVLMLVGS